MGWGGNNGTTVMAGVLANKLYAAPQEGMYCLACTRGIYDWLLLCACTCEYRDTALSLH